MFNQVMTVNAPSDNDSRLGVRPLWRGGTTQSGQRAAWRGIAPGGASLDVDDVVGETDQDRGGGRAPCSAGDLPDGGGGDPTGIVPGPFWKGLGG